LRLVLQDLLILSPASLRKRLKVKNRCMFFATLIICLVNSLSPEFTAMDLNEDLVKLYEIDIDFDLSFREIDLFRN
jgi:hypothetical protein